MIHQAVFDTSELLFSYGVKEAVLSPGSRNAPLTISFARNGNIKKTSIVDERSAGFIALGIALKSKNPVALCCTSGTALLNYGPACAEAYYQQVPLIIISADRPSELIDQRDGQTIRQIGALNNFVKGSFNLPEDSDDPNFPKEYLTTLKTALSLATTSPKGPVHINVPFRDPFYPEAGQILEYGEFEKIEPIEMASEIDFEPFIEYWNNSTKKIILRGQDYYDKEYDQHLNQLKNAVIIADIISNVQIGKALRKQDLFLSSVDDSVLGMLKPEILITSGKSIISKNLKLFLRQQKPKEHWHFEICDDAPDTFQSITTHFKADIKDFLNVLTANQKPLTDQFQTQIAQNYQQSWETLERVTAEVLDSELQKAEFSEFSVIDPILKIIPSNSNLHLANSMPVRYVNFFQSIKKGVEVFANRGTSGIDGSNSTAVGCALANGQITTLISGDLSFFYDRNAFFHQENLANLRMIVINNGGGGIFRILPDSSSLPELETYFETRHHHSAIHIANEYDFEYHAVHHMNDLFSSLSLFYESAHNAKLIEIFTTPATNHWVFKKVKAAIRTALI